MYQAIEKTYIADQQANSSIHQENSPMHYTKNGWVLKVDLYFCIKFTRLNPFYEAYLTSTHILYFGLLLEK